MKSYEEAVKEVNEVWDLLIDNEFFTEQELQLVTCICGYSIETLNDCIYARYGYNDIEQFMEEEVF